MQFCRSVRGYFIALICKDLSSSGDCVSWKLPKQSFLANRVQDTVRQSTDSHVQVQLAVIHLPPHCLGRRSQWCTYGKSSCPHHTCNHFSIDFSISNSEVKHDYVDFKDLAATQWLNICYFVRKTHIRKILGSFRYRKSANFFGVTVRESRIHRFCNCKSATFSPFKS